MKGNSVVLTRLPAPFLMSKWTWTTIPKECNSISLHLTTWGSFSPPPTPISFFRIFLSFFYSIHADEFLRKYLVHTLVVSFFCALASCLLFNVNFIPFYELYFEHYFLLLFYQCFAGNSLLFIVFFPFIKQNYIFTFFIHSSLLLRKFHFLFCLLCSSFLAICFLFYVV